MILKELFLFTGQLFCALLSVHFGKNLCKMKTNDKKVSQIALIFLETKKL